MAPLWHDFHGPSGIIQYMSLPFTAHPDHPQSKVAPLESRIRQRMTITRQGTRAFTRKCRAQVQKEDAPITGPRGVIKIWGHFLVIH